MTEMLEGGAAPLLHHHVQPPHQVEPSHCQGAHRAGQPAEQVSDIKAEDEVVNINKVSIILDSDFHIDGGGRLDLGKYWDFE